MSAVDVLAVMDAASNVLRMDPTADPQLQLEQARAAVAELIEAAWRADSKLLHLTEHQLRGEICAETREDWRALHAALAGVGGGK